MITPQKSSNLLVAFCLALATLALATTANADDVISDLSKHDVPIEWDFRGTNILLFGAVDSTGPSDSKPDVVIVVRGPNTNITARKKSRIAGVWANTDSHTFFDVPSYYSIVSTKPLQQIASKADLKSYGLGFDALIQKFNDGQKNTSTSKPDGFSRAIARILRKDGLYKQDPHGVTIIGNRLFRADIALPANVPVGQFTSKVYLFRDGKLVSQQTSSLHIQKQGFEQVVYTLAYDYPFLYGIMAVALAIIAGLAASALLKRD